MELSNSAIAFIAAIERRWGGYNIAPGCKGSLCEYAEDDTDPENHSCEASFSWSHCESCGSHLGGNRSKAQAFKADNSDGTVTEIEICVDCLMWHANGELPENWRA